MRKLREQIRYSSLVYTQIGKDKVLIRFCFKSSKIFVNNVSNDVLRLQFLRGKGKGKDHPRTGHESPDGE